MKMSLKWSEIRFRPANAVFFFLHFVLTMLHGVFKPYVAYGLEQHALCVRKQQANIEASLRGPGLFSERVISVALHTVIRPSWKLFP